MFAGFVEMDSTILIPLVTEDAGTATDADSLPLFRVYGDSGLLASAGGTCAFKDAGSVSDASNASPIVISSTGHNLSTGMRITVVGVLGNTAANNTWSIIRIDGNSFSLTGSTGNGAYAGAGTWHVTGLYDASVTPTIATQFASGQSFTVVVNAIMGGDVLPQSFTFVVT